MAVFEKVSGITQDGLVNLIANTSRREVERHKDRMLGITASVPKFGDRGDGQLEYVVDVRVGNKETQGLVKNVLVAQGVQGVVTDMNVPVVLERSEGGRLTVTARAAVRLPNVRVSIYNYGALGMAFAANAKQDSTGRWVDGYGYPTADPTGVVEVTKDWQWQQGFVTIDDLDIDNDRFDETFANWQIV